MTPEEVAMPMWPMKGRNHLQRYTLNIEKSEQWILDGRLKKVCSRNERERSPDDAVGVAVSLQVDLALGHFTMGILLLRHAQLGFFYGSHSWSSQEY